MLPRSTQAVIDALGDLIAAIDKQREVLTEHFFNDFPAIFQTAMTNAGATPVDAAEAYEVLKHYLSSLRESLVNARHSANEASAQLIDSRTRAARGGGSINFKI